MTARSTAGERDPFDAGYYRRFYEDPKTRVYTADDVERLGAFVLGYVRHLRVPVRRVLDIGCGLGHWRKPVAKHFPGARYRGVEHSDYLCERHGWERGSVVDYRARAPFDLVICQGVLQYVPHRDAALALDNLARLCRGVLYLEALTIEDWQQNCDRRKTDRHVHLRRGDWYRRRLRPAFVNCGGGVFARRDAGIVLYELEQAGR
jgi:2-polyprenyl-3-methyl-5-hydroxy-6-metoxy-1,4-benzoquinol methylase